jgi:hypothetical protein
MAEKNENNKDSQKGQVIPKTIFKKKEIFVNMAYCPDFIIHWVGL